jgi:hypothetical protein
MAYDIDIQDGFCSIVNTEDATDVQCTNLPLTISMQGDYIKCVGDTAESVFSFNLAQEDFNEINGVDVTGDTLAQIYTALQTAITPA